MGRWILKTEPDSYSWADLLRDRRTVWDGITNALALKNLRTARKGDLAMIYHTGGERAAIGVARLASDPYPDPKLADAKMAVVDLVPGKALAQPVTLAELKCEPLFKGSDLLRLARLSVVPVTEAMWKRIEELAAS
jgi:predicted RNA-binding protein with PUA-like domain